MPLNPFSKKCFLFWIASTKQLMIQRKRPKRSGGFKGEKGKSWGYAYGKRQLNETWKHELLVDAKGAPFDPNLTKQSLRLSLTKSIKKLSKMNTQRLYLNGRLLRPAMVSVRYLVRATRIANHWLGSQYEREATEKRLSVPPVFLMKDLWRRLGGPRFFVISRLGISFETWANHSNLDLPTSVMP